MKNFYKKFKKEIIIFFICFFIYFLLGSIISYYLNTSNFWNVLFDMDTPRVLKDLSLIDYNHYRIAVHPLMIIMFQPIVIILTKIINSSIISILLLQSLFASLSASLIYFLSKKLLKSDRLSLLFTIIFAASFGQIIFTSAIETYIFAQTFLIVLWVFVYFKIDKKFNYWDYIILVILGILSLAITITNFFQFIIAIFFVVFLNKNINKRFFTSCIILIITGCISVSIAEIQNIFWPSAPNFFTKALSDFLYGSSEEMLYITKSFNFNNILNVINSNFSFSHNIFNLIIPVEGSYITFQKNIISDLFSITCSLLFFGFNIYFIIKNKKQLKNHKFYLALLFSYLFNFCLHLIYGNEISFLYICHYNFLIILITIYIFKELFDLKKLKKDKFIFILELFAILLGIRSIYLTLSLMLPTYNAIEYFSLIPILVLCLNIIIIILLIIKNKYIKISLIILSILISYFIYENLNYTKETCDVACTVVEKLEKSLNSYKYQLKEMKNIYNVYNFSDRDEEIGIYFFGMADRRKIVYKDGKLLDAFTEEIIKEFEYKNEMIVPNEYSVVLENPNGNYYIIYENEKGIYVNNNGKIETIDESENKINLPEFNDKKYSEILKVLHQEILFNIKEDLPTPNIFGYKTAWYRDTMLGTKVLEITNNVNILSNWVNSIDSVYDFSRSKDIAETDNLGELLYILGAVENNRNDLISDILEEIERIKLPDKTIKGNVDGLIQAYYPTVLAIHGAKKLGIEIDLVEPLIDDGYAKLTWYHDKPIASSYIIESYIYPYLNWAYYHYAGYGNIYVLDEIYPLSYEAGDDLPETKVSNECFISQYYCEKDLYLSHMWHASEMFLFLIEEVEVKW